MKSQKYLVPLWAVLSSLTLVACNQLPGSIDPNLVENLPVTADPSATPSASATPAGSPASTPTGTATPTPAPVDSNGKVALVYADNGVCPEDCAEASAEVARLAGLTPKLVKGNSLSDSSTPADVDAFFKNAVVWIEPGGYARQSWEGMSKKLQTSLKEFVRTGGGYVGFCAGAFMATAQIGGTGATGLGIFPGKTYPYSGSTIVNLTWEGKAQPMYWEGGPYFYNYDSTVEVTALYKNGSVAAARTQYGMGRVYLSGPHPEAPGWWSGQGASSSVSGPTQQIAADMVKWSARLK